MTALCGGPSRAGGRVHLAVMREPWLSDVLAGRKTIESRFARAVVPPYGVVGVDDLLLFKRAAGPVCATARVAHVAFHDLAREGVEGIRERFSAALCADDAFWADRRDARYATLMHLDDVRPVPDLHVDKRDRRGWVVLDDVPPVHADQLQLAGLGGSPSSAPRLAPVEFPAEQHADQLVLPGLLAA